MIMEVFPVALEYVSQYPIKKLLYSEELAELSTIKTSHVDLVLVKHAQAIFVKL